MYVENLWLFCVALFTLGAIAGYFMFKLQIWLNPNKYNASNRKFSSIAEDNQETSDLRLVLQKQEAEFQNYYQTVITHYVKTAKLLEDLDGDYKLLSQHLKSNVFKVVEKNDFYKAMKEVNAKIDDLSANHITSGSIVFKKGNIGLALKQRLKSALHFLPKNKSQGVLGQANRSTKRKRNEESYEMLNDEVDSNSLASSTETISNSTNQSPVDDRHKSIQEAVQNEDLLQPSDKGTKTTSTSEHKNPIKHEEFYAQDHKTHTSSASTSKEEIGIDSSFSKE